jgi:hypothetical protein
MVKKTKRYNRRPQKGGIFGLFEEEKTYDVNGNATSDSGILSNLNKYNPFASSPAPAPSYPAPAPSYPAPAPSYPAPAPAPSYPAPSYPAPSYPAPDPIGGRRRKHMRGGIGSSNSLGLTYYASPVNGIKVAEPTYMEFYKGGRSKSRRIRGGTLKPTRTEYITTKSESVPSPLLSSVGGSRRKSRKRRMGKKCNKTCRKRHRHCRK